MFAINMLVNTPKGGTFTFRELSEDLLAAGFRKPSFLHKGEGMDSVIQALKYPFRARSEAEIEKLKRPPLCGIIDKRVDGFFKSDRTAAFL